MISRHGNPVALIDWEAAGPVDRLTELAMIAWNNAQLYDDDVAERNRLPDTRKPDATSAPIRRWILPRGAGTASSRIQDH